MSQKVTIDYKCRRCGRIQHKPVENMTAKQLRLQIRLLKKSPTDLHECSKKVFGIMKLVGYSEPLKD